MCWQKSLRVEALLQTLQWIFKCIFIKIHIVNSCWRRSLRVEALLQTEGLFTSISSSCFSSCYEGFSTSWSRPVQLLKACSHPFYHHLDAVHVIKANQVMILSCTVIEGLFTSIFIIILLQFMLWRLFNIMILSCTGTEGMFTSILSSSCSRSCYEGFTKSWSCLVQSLKAWSHQNKCTTT